MSLERFEVLQDGERELEFSGLQVHEIDERDQDAQRSVEPVSEALPDYLWRSSIIHFTSSAIQGTTVAATVRPASAALADHSVPAL